MDEEFSKLSLKSKSIITSQTMNWTIPQSRLNQQCPFLEKQFPYYTTDFSFLHFSSDLELKWRLVLEKKGDFVNLNLINTNDGSVFERKEMKNVELKWNLLQNQDQKEESDLGDDVSLFDESPTIAIEFQTLRFGSPKGLPLCRADDFESFAANGRYTFDIRINLEYFQEKKKFSLIQQAKRLSSSISEMSAIYSKSSRSRSSTSSRNRNSVQSNSWIGNLPNFMTSSLSRKSSFSRPTYQCSRPPSPPRSSMQQFSYPAASQVGQCEDGFRSPHVPPKGIPVNDYKYHEPVYSRITDVRASVPVTDMLEKEVCDQEIIRRSKSGRLPSVISHLNGADDTMDSRISQETSRGDEIYSAITENVFFTPLKHSTQDVRSVFQSLSTRQYRGDQFSTLPTGTRPQLQSTPQEPQHLPRLNIYANIPEEFHTAGSPRPPYRSESPRQFSPSLRKNFLYASHRAVPGSSPFVNSVKAERQNSFSINKVGLPNTSRETPAEVGNNSRQIYSQENSGYVYETGPACSEANNCVI